MNNLAKANVWQRHGERKQSFSGNMAKRHQRENGNENQYQWLA
jgi:hypothetical protein